MLIKISILHKCHERLIIKGFQRFGKTVVKSIARFFNSQITDACSAQSAENILRGHYRQCYSKTH